MEQQFTKLMYLIRHGETEPNRNQIIQGSGIDARLNSLGQEQAKDFFLTYKEVDFDQVYTSALKRTSESVQDFLQKGIPHASIRELNEISWGVKDGTKINFSEQGEYDALLKSWKSGQLDQSFEKGESPNQVAIRLQRALNEILNRSAEKKILVCMHGRAMRILLCLLLEVPLTEMEQFLHSNLCLYILGWDGMKWQVLKANDTAHLKLGIPAN